MTIDDRRLTELIDHSKDLQSEAISGAKASLPDLRDMAADRGRVSLAPEQIAAYETGRRGVLRNLGLGGGAIATRGLLAGGIGAALTALLTRPAAADEALDIQILQTASSLEALAVATYEAALGLDFIKNGNATIVAFAKETMKQHSEHKMAFQAQTKALGGKAQDTPNSKFAPVVESAKPTLKAPLDVVGLAATLEQVATDTYLMDLTLFDDKKSIEIMGSVMGVESQHLAVLRAVKALLEGGGEALIKIPTDLAKLPAAAGSVAFPEPFEDTPADFIAEPETGAVK